MKIKLLQDKHLTKLDRDAIKYMIENDVTVCASKQKRYTFEAYENEADTYDLVSKHNETNDYGKVIVRTSRAKIQIIK